VGASHPFAKYSQRVGHPSASELEPINELLATSGIRVVRIGNNDSSIVGNGRIGDYGRALPKNYVGSRDLYGTDANRKRTQAGAAYLPATEPRSACDIADRFGPGSICDAAAGRSGV
jgi:hypothetical protein